MRTAEPRVSLCSWAFFFPRFSSSPWHGACYSPSFPRASPPSPVITVATHKQRQLQRLLALSWDAGPSQRENLQKAEKRRKMGSEKNTCHSERDKLRCSKEDGRGKKGGEQGCSGQLLGSKALGRREEALPALPLLEMQIWGL